MKKRPIMINTAPPAVHAREKKKKQKDRNQTYNTRSTAIEEPELEESSSSAEEVSSKDDILSIATSDSTDSSGYSDWVNEKTGGTLEPPKRLRRKAAIKKIPVDHRTDSEIEMEKEEVSKVNKIFSFFN